MSSIVGIVSRDGRPIDRDRLRRMVDRSIAWEGSARELWIGEGIGLGHTLRANTPESVGEQQPWVEPQSGLVITANARVDNREELLEKLGMPEKPLRTDAQIILLAYLKWGRDLFRHLVGDYAFAIWDPRERRLFCARDYIGSQQLYFYEDSKLFLFASDMSALMAAGYVPREINPDKIAEVLLKRTNNANTTIYREVKALSPAGWIQVSAGDSNTGIHWSPEVKQELRLGSSDAYVEAYHDLLQRAVKARMRSPFPIGSTLSSGLDSSAVTWYAREMASASNQEIHAYSYGDLDDPNTSVEKCVFADRFLERHPMSHRYQNWAQEGVFRSNEDLLRALGVPFRDATFDRVTSVCGHLVSRGGRTLLMGQGGDLLATSHAYDYLFGLMCQGRWIRLAREIRLQAQNTKRSVTSIIRGELLGPIRRSSIAGPGFASNEYQRDQPLTVVPCVARPEFVTNYFKSAVKYPAASWRDVWTSPVRANQIASLFHGRYQPFYQSPVSVAAASGVEVRCPLLDQRLSEFCLAVPAAQHRSEGWNRWLIRRAMKDILPDEIVWTPRKSNEPTDPWGPFRSQKVARFIAERIEEYRADDEVTQYLDLDLLNRYWQACEEASSRPFDIWNTDNVMESKRRHFSRGFLFAAFLHLHKSTD